MQPLVLHTSQPTEHPEDLAQEAGDATALEEQKVAADVLPSTIESPKAQTSPSLRRGSQLSSPLTTNPPMRLLRSMWHHSAFKAKTRRSLWPAKIVGRQSLRYGVETRVVTRFATLVVRGVF